MHRLTRKFFPFTFNIVDLAKMFSAILLVLTVNNLVLADPVWSVITLALYAANKQFIETAKDKMSITPNPDPAGKLPGEPLPEPSDPKPTT